MTGRIIIHRRSGFFSDFLIILKCICVCENNNLTPYVEWHNSLYADCKQNLWPTFFEPCGDEGPEESIPVKCARNGVPVRVHGMSVKRSLSFVFQKYVRIRTNIISEVRTLIDGLPSNILGVHLRDTDRRLEPQFAFPGLDHFWRRTIELFERHRINSVFIASDSYPNLVDFANRCRSKGKEVCFRKETIRSLGSESIHGDLDSGVAGDRLEKARGALIDCLMLSKCSVMIRGTSNLSAIALVMNPDMPFVDLSIESGSSGAILEAWLADDATT